MKRIKISRISRPGLVQFTLYNLGGIAFFVVGYGVFALLYGLASWWWWTAKIVADLAGWTVNYLIQRYAVFHHESKSHRERDIIKRFSVISLANVPLDYALVGALKWAGVSPFIGLWLSSLFFTFWKYLWYKHYVFRLPKK